MSDLLKQPTSQRGNKVRERRIGILGGVICWIFKMISVATLPFRTISIGMNRVCKEKAKELKDSAEGEIELAKAAYYFVRDEIKHSWDVQDKRVTATASDALREGVGICWAKSNLLAALLRANGIPAGICYQRLTLGSTPESGYCIHALNATYLRSIDRWIRVDARGNKEGVQADFSVDDERLAFPIRKEYDEVDYKTVYAEPLPQTMSILENSTDALYMYLHSLPERI